MSLFEESDYRYRETCFVMFARENRPTAEQLSETLRALGDRYQLSECIASNSEFESLCVRCPDDHAALDISYVEGEDVTDQIPEIQGEFRRASLNEEELAKLDGLANATARFDVFHFEQIVPGGDPEDGFLDPGAMLVVLQTLAKLTGGTGVDAQSETLL